MRRRVHKGLALIVSLCMVVMLLPMAALAADPAGSLTITSVVPGTAVGTTSITIQEEAGQGNSLVYKVSDTQVSDLTVEDTVTDGTAFTNGIDIAVTAGQYVTVYEITASSTVVRYVCRQIAESEIKAAPANKSALTAKIDEQFADEGRTTYALAEDEYISGRWSAYASAINDAISVENDPDAAQDEVDAAIAAIDTARENLITVETFSGFAEKYLRAMALYEADFTADSWSALQAVISGLPPFEDIGSLQGLEAWVANSTFDEAGLSAKTADIRTAIEGLVLELEYSITIGDEFEGVAGTARAIEITVPDGGVLGNKTLVVKLQHGTDTTADVHVFTITPQNPFVVVSYSKAVTEIEVWLADITPKLLEGDMDSYIYAHAQIS